MTAESTSTHQAEQSLHRQRHSNVFMLTGLSTEIKDDQLLQAWPAKSAFVVREIVQTERLYVQSLYEIVQVRYPYKCTKGAKCFYSFSQRRDMLRRYMVVCCRLAEVPTSFRLCFLTSSNCVICTG